MILKVYTLGHTNGRRQWAYYSSSKGILVGHYTRARVSHEREIWANCHGACREGEIVKG